MDFSQFSANAGLTSLTVQNTAEDHPYISTTSNPGNMRINAEAAEVMGVDYGQVNTESKDDPGVRMEFAARKWNGEMTNLVYLLAAGSKQGSKLASPSRQNGGILQCSSANAWNKLGGDKEELKWYIVDRNKTAVAFAPDSTALTLPQAEEAGLIADGLWTELAVQAGITPEAGKPAKVMFALTYDKSTAKREVSGVTGRPKAEKTAEKPFAADNAENTGVEDANNDVSDDDFDL